MTKIATVKVIPAMQRGELSEVVGIASRDRTKAELAARALRIPKAYGSYAEMLADPEIEAVYNPLPNHLHVPVSIQAAEAGKHVLYEKPIGMGVSFRELPVSSVPFIADTPTPRRLDRPKPLRVLLRRTTPIWQP